MGSDTIIIANLDSARPPYSFRARGAVTQHLNGRLEFLAAERPAFVCAVAGTKCYEMGSDTIIIANLDSARPPYSFRARGAVT
jgi:hypothetical protein